MGLRDKIKNAGQWAGGLVIILIVLALPLILLFGLTWFSVMVSPWLRPVFFLALAITIFILGPLAFFRKTRSFSAAAMMFSSYIFGIVLWITSLLWTYELWGTIAVIVGLLILGIGIVPIALLATIFHAEWWLLLDLVVLVFMTFGLRALAYWLGVKAANDEIYYRRDR